MGRVWWVEREEVFAFGKIIFLNRKSKDDFYSSGTA